jgi:hypothetical protein
MLGELVSGLLGVGDESYYEDPRVGEALQAQAKLSAEGLQFAKQVYAENSPLAKKTAQSNYDTMVASNKFAADQRKRYTDSVVPLEDQFIQEAKTAGSAESQARAAADAGASFSTTINARDQANARRAAAYGYGYQSPTNNAASAAAMTGVTNAARRAEENRGTAMRANAINMGRGFAADTNASYGLGINAGSAGIQNSWAGVNNVMQGYGMGIGGQENLASGYGQIAAGQNAFRSNQDAAQGALVGTVIGGAIAAKPWKQ